MENQEPDNNVVQTPFSISVSPESAAPVSGNMKNVIIYCDGKIQTNGRCNKCDRTSQSSSIDCNQPLIIPFHSLNFHHIQNTTEPIPSPELSRLRSLVKDMHNKIMVQWEKDFGSIHKDQNMDAYTVSGFIKSILDDNLKANP